MGPKADNENTGLKYFGHTCDLRYQNVASDLVKSFMANKKVKKIVLPKSKDAMDRALAENPRRLDKLFSHVHVHKYHESVLWGAEQVGYV